jgi:two-component system sensor histidine kinase DesK
MPGEAPRPVPESHLINPAVTWLWRAFVGGWLLVLVATGVLLVRDPRSRPHLPAALLLLVVLGCLYLWLALRFAIGPEDLTPAGPGRPVLRRRFVLLAAMALVVAMLVRLLPHAGEWWLAMHIIIAAGLSLPPAAAAGVIGALVAGVLWVASLVGGRFDPLLLILLAFGAAAIAIRQLTISVEQLRTARAALAHWAVDQERLRFARDLHDLLGHSLSLITLKSELAGRLLPVSPDRAAVEVSDVERAARTALQQVRAAVVGYRQPRLRTELSAACEVLAAAGIGVGIEDMLGPPSPELDSLLAWAVREGVTNVVRHSRARRCEICLVRVGDAVRLTLSDDGPGPDGGVPAAGSGLIGLAERAAAHGGTVEAVPLPEGGFRLTVNAPATVGAAEGTA